MTERYHLYKHCLRNDEIYDFYSDCSLTSEEVVKRLNQLNKDKQSFEELIIEYKNISGILDDFIEITNKLQKNPTDIALQNIARDMLMMMGVEEV